MTERLAETGYVHAPAMPAWALTPAALTVCPLEP
jgi:hypothetical protein